MRTLLGGGDVLVCIRCFVRPLLTRHAVDILVGNVPASILFMWNLAEAPETAIRGKEYLILNDE